MAVGAASGDLVSTVFAQDRSIAVLGMNTRKFYYHGRDGVGVMLVLSRKAGERILIGDDVAITVVRIGPNSVRIGIEAPKAMNIVREELCDFGPDKKKTATESQSSAALT